MFDRIFAERQREADEFYASLAPSGLSGDARNVMRQAFAGLLWSNHLEFLKHVFHKLMLNFTW